MQKTHIAWFASLIIAATFILSTTMVARATGQSAAANASSITIPSAADAYVVKTSSTTNYGSNLSLRVDSSPVTHSYVRFVVSGLNGAAIQSAVLRVYAKSNNSKGFSVLAEGNNSWVENKITYSNAPAVGSVIASSKAILSGTWVSVDISSYIKSEGTYSLVLTSTSSTNTSLAARETSGKAPQLVITTAATSTVTPQSTKTPVPTSSKTSTPTPVPSSTPTTTGGSSWQPSFPIRAAFYYPWFPEAWTQLNIYPYTYYTPKLGYYSSLDQNILKQHIAMMQYGNIQAGIASWWGQGSQTDTKIGGLLSAATGTNFRWSLYYENESMGDPTASQIQGDLTYIQNKYAKDPGFLRVNGKFVVFVYSDANDACGMADRWKQGNTIGAYIVLKVFPGYANCASQPDAWHQYSPAVATDQQGSFSYSISPGFWLKGNAVRLTRDLSRWALNVQAMVASGAKWQLVTTFSEWGEGTAVEPASEWASSSGYGQYLDLLHTNGK